MLQKQISKRKNIFFALQRRIQENYYVGIEIITVFTEENANKLNLIYIELNVLTKAIFPNVLKKNIK